MSLEQGLFPDELKVARVVPLYKAGDPKNISNYRHVSLLNSISKIFERSFYNQLNKYITSENILYDHQYGFRPNHSTNYALLTLTNKITEALDNNEYMVGLFLDFLKAFDTVNHGILLSKLKAYGIKKMLYDG